MKTTTANANASRKSVHVSDSREQRFIERITEASEQDNPTDVTISLEGVQLVGSETNVPIIGENELFTISFVNPKYNNVVLSLDNNGVFVNNSTADWKTIGNPSTTLIQLQNNNSKNAYPVATITVGNGDETAQIIIVGTVPTLPEDGNN